MKKLFTTQNKIIIYLLKSKLEANGINCIIKNDQPPLAGEIPPIMAWPELWLIEDQQLDQAKEIIHKELYERNESNTAWKCSSCGEISPGEFNICWKCGNSR